MIKPVNGHILIEPVVHEAFMASQHETYEQIGKVVAVSDSIGHYLPTVVGTKVYFDGWLAAKYPKEGGKDGEYYWLVRWDDVRAVEQEAEPDHVEQEIPE